MSLSTKRNRPADVGNVCVVAKGEGEEQEREWRGSVGIRDGALIHGMDKRQGPTAQHRDIWPISCEWTITEKDTNAQNQSTLLCSRN